MIEDMGKRPAAEQDVAIDPAVWRIVFVIAAILAVAYVNFRAIVMGEPMLGLMAMVAVVLLIWGVSQPKTILYWVLGYYAMAPILNSIQPRGTQVGTFTLLLLACIVLMQSALRARKPRRLHVIDYLILIQIIALITGYRDYFGITPWLGGFKQESKYLVMFLLLRYIDLSERDIRVIIRIILGLAFLIGAYAIVQYFFDYYRLLPFVRTANFMKAYGGQNSNVYAVKRAYSFLLSPLTLGYAMMLTGLLAPCVAATLPKHRIVERRLVWLTAFVSIGALLLSFTRSAWAGYAVGVMAMFFFKKTRQAAVFIVIAGLISLPVLYVIRPSTFTDFWLRFSSLFSGGGHASAFHYLYLKYSWLYVLHHPFGAGLGTATFSARRFFTRGLWTESEILNKGVQCGWFGLASFVAVLVAMAVLGWKLAHRGGTSWLRGLGIYAFAGILACATAASTGLVWVSWVTSSWYWMLTAITFTYAETNHLADCGREPPPDVVP